MNQIELITRLTGVTEVFAYKSPLLTPAVIKSIHDKLHLPYGFFLSAEFRQPKVSDVYLELSDNTDSDAVNYCICSYIGKGGDKSLPDSYCIISVMDVTTHLENKFDLQKHKTAWYKGSKVTILSKVVDSELQVAILDSMNKIRAVDVIALADTKIVSQKLAVEHATKTLKERWYV